MNEEYGEDLVKAYSCITKSLVEHSEDVGMESIHMSGREQVTEIDPSFTPQRSLPFQLKLT